MLKESFQLTRLHYSSRGLHKENSHAYPKTWAHTEVGHILIHFKAMFVLHN